MNKPELATLVILAARLTGRRVSRERADDVARALAGVTVPLAPLEWLRTAWQAADLDGQPGPLAAPHPRDCPFLAWHAARGWLAVTSRSADESWLAHRADGTIVRLADLDKAHCCALPARPARPQSAPSAARLVWSSLWRCKPVFAEALVATGLVNILALSASIFSMQVYDRVIPNYGFQTLWVLSLGVLGALLLEFMLRQVRGIAMEKTTLHIDAHLSGWLFERALGIRLEARPPAIGTLAAQIKGFEMVRAAMSGASIFMLADLPFTLFFIAVIAAIGGWLVLVPLALLPVSLITGLMFQRQIARHTREQQGHANRKAGLLVESIDGADSVKANGGEWKLQWRWRALVDEAGRSEYFIRHYSSLSQHLTVALQQAGYVGLVAAGAWLVTQNQLTMGALIACTIVHGRALSPIAQLPALMVQWEHARAAMAGLDQLIHLPNEIDEREVALNPGTLAPSMRLDGVRFAYGAASDAAVDVARLDIRAGEKVGIIGAIGSGKSTLLKLASGLYRPAQGKVFLGGIDAALLSVPYVRETVAYLPQDVRLTSGTLRDNLLQGLPDPGDEALLHAARETGLIQLIAHHPRGLALPITEGGRGISGGQRQLVALTRMVLSRPAVLLLDEPTASMDPATEAQAVALLASPAYAQATLVVATHKTALLPMLDRLLVMQNGRIVMDGPRELVLARLTVAAGNEQRTAHAA